MSYEAPAPGVLLDTFYPDQWAEYNDYLSYTGIRGCMINGAVDESLALSIWNVVSTNKPRRRLDSLNITCIDRNRSEWELLKDYNTIMEALMRSYWLTSSERDDTDEVAVMDLKKGRPEALINYYFESEKGMDELGPYFREKKGAIEIFRKTWPSTDENLDMRNGWRSWPLERSSSL